MADDPFNIEQPEHIPDSPQSYEDWRLLSVRQFMTDDEVTAILSKYAPDKHKKFRAKARRYQEVQIVIAQEMVKTQVHPTGQLNTASV